MIGRMSHDSVRRAAYWRSASLAALLAEHPWRSVAFGSVKCLTFPRLGDLNLSSSSINEAIYYMLVLLISTIYST